MAMYKLLIDEFYDTSFSLLAIHCRLEDYKLSYLLNKHLGIYLKRLDKDLEYNNSLASYSLYEWEDEQNGINWNLISNVCKREEESLNEVGLLFGNNQKMIKIHHLMPELKDVDYLIKINHSQDFFDSKPILTKIQTISHVIATYEVDVNQLKFKEHLIF